MGNDNSVEVPAWGKNCKMFDKVDNRYGGAIQIWSEMNNHFARRDINIRSEEELKRMIAEINRRSILVHKRFSTVKNYQVIDQSDFCSRTHTLSLCFEYFDNDLSREVAKRAQTGVILRLFRTISENRRSVRFYTRSVIVCGTWSSEAPSTVTSSLPTSSSTKISR